MYYVWFSSCTILSEEVLKPRSYLRAAVGEEMQKRIS